ncbi:unnamed protein product [Cercopithifilaria johnstoni]|uniref:Uncharacterized protein n=1 Tax=Cercopithifilaria johnstoni TaxID=2874296 RepID=A0A8J2MNF7_9BILA|nr:unnamed protein product [Cercopithifilaria johnstoni]
MSVQAEIITNSGVADVVESVSKACMKPITSDVLRQLSKLLRKMELGRKLCMRRAVINQNLLPKAICEKIAFDETHNETTDIDKRKFNNLETRQNAFDYCAAITAPIKKHCEALKQCCPNYIRCTELMAQMNVSKKYEELLNRIKQIQSNCEKKMMETLQSFDSVFKLPV